jgi:hypothetical protein
MPAPSPKKSGPSIPVKTAVLLLVIILLLAILPTTAMAAGGPPEGSGSGGDGQGGPPDRDVDVEVEPKRARIRSSVQGSDGGSDELGYVINAQNQLSIEMQYRNQAESEHANVQMTINFRQMLEYEDVDGNGYLGPGDEIVSTYDLEKAQWEALEHVDQNTEEGKKVHTITARTGDGVFAMVSHTTETQAQTQWGELSPNLMKIDLIVDDFPWTRTNTRLALRATVENEGTITHVADPAKRQYMGENEAGIESNDDGDVGFYTWVRSADVDGTSSQVTARVSNDAEGTTLQFNYAQGDSIIHDPKLGVPMLDEGLFDVMERLMPYLAALGAGAIVIGAAVYWRKRQD